MVDLTGILGGPWSPPNQIKPDAPEIQLADAMRANGIEPPTNIRLDGQLHRFGTKGRKKDDSGWYVAFGDGVPAGSFGCWRDGISVNWQADVGRELTAAEKMAHTKRMAEARAARDAATKARQETAADTVAEIWSGAGAASPDHPYLKRKGIQPHGARVTGDGRLMVPLYDGDGRLSSLQYIDDDRKLYHPGGKAKECTWIIGDPGKVIYVAEGFATAATIHEITGEAVAVAYSASNIPSTVGQIRERFGISQKIVIVADHDHHGVGRNHADQAAALYGAVVVMPPIPGHDANDYHLAGHDLAALLTPKPSDWLTRAKDFSLEPAPIKWLIKNWIQQNALIMVHGPSGGGKTFVVLDWCLHISSGLEGWHKHNIASGDVVYLAGEGHHGLKSRVAAWRQHHAKDDPGLYISGSGCDLNMPDGYNKAAEAIRGLPNQPRLIVVDTLHRFLAGDENSSQDAKTMLDACAALMAEFSCSVLLVHHTGVSDEAQHRGRGSSAYKGAIDIEISVVPPKRDGDSIGIVQRKAKDAELARDIHVDLKKVEIKGWLDNDGEPVTSCVITLGAEPIKARADNPTAKAQKLFERAWFFSGAEILNDAPYVTKSALQAFLEKDGYSESTAKNYLKPSYPNGIIGQLLPVGIIETAHHGWIIVDKIWASAMMVARVSKPSDAVSRP